MVPLGSGISRYTLGIEPWRIRATKFLILILLGVLAVVGMLWTAGPALAQPTFIDPGFTTETVASLPPYSAMGVAFAPDGRLFVWQKAGQVLVIKNGQAAATPFVDISDHVNQYLDHGLLGLALDPNFAVNGYVYLAYVYEGGGNPNDQGPKVSRLSRVQADPVNSDVALSGETVIVDNIPSEAGAHSIDSLRFGADGKLFVSIGDGATDLTVDPLALRAQDLNSWNGKILRINADGSAPSDNPFYDSSAPEAVQSKVWAYGLRNLFRFALHPKTGELYVGDAGWRTWEELNRGRGMNFGWPCYEGEEAQAEYQVFAECQGLARTATTGGVYVYDHSVGRAIIAGSFYTGGRYPTPYQGNLFVADYSAGWIRRLAFDANGNLVSVNRFANNFNGLIDIELGPEGLLYYVASASGEVGRIRYSGEGNLPLVTKARGKPGAGYVSLKANLSIAATAEVSGYAMTVPNPNTQSVALPSGVLPPANGNTGTGHFDFAFANSTVFKKNGWDFFARTATGAPRNTEQTGAWAVDYDQSAHPGTLRVPLDSGELWQASNNSQNTFFHDLPTNWTSVRLRIAAFNPASNYQQVGLLAYQDDDNYVDLNRSYVGGQQIELFWEIRQTPAYANRLGLLNKGNLLLRLDRDVATNTYTGYYSVDSGLSWVLVGSTAAVLNETRVGVQTGSNLAGTLAADLAWVEIVAVPAAPTVASVTPGAGVQGQTVASARISGSNFQSGATCNFGAGVTVNSCTFVSATQLTASVTIATNTTIGSRTVTVKNPDGQSASLRNAFSVTPATMPPPSVTSVSPSTGMQSQVMTGVVITGSNFQGGAVCDFGGGITVTSCTRTSPTQLTANLSVAMTAVVGEHTVTVLNPDIQSAALTHGFRVTPAVLSPPSLTGVSPSIGTQGQTLASVVITGSNFQSGATCSFGDGITVTNCTFNSSNQLTASVAIAANATVGIRAVTVTNPDAQRGALASAFSVVGSISTAPVVSLLSPDSSTEGQSLTVTITGSNFVAGATCSFGAGIVVNSCLFNSSTQLIASIAVAANAATAPVETRTVTVTNPDSQSGAFSNGFTIMNTAALVGHFDFIYPDRTSLLADNWDFIATTASGNTRNTEQIGSLAINYSQTTHPGTIRIPLGAGELWQTSNNSQNMLFRNLPSDWTSIRLKIASFDPVKDDQQVGLIAYQDDDTYVSVRRSYHRSAGGPSVGGMYEVNGVGTVIERRGLANTGNLILRLDRNLSTNAYTPFYSVDSGTTWIRLMGIPIVALNNPRLAIQVGANLAADAKSADLAWVEVIRPSCLPTPTISGVTPASCEQGRQCSVIITGANLQSGVGCSFGPAITVNSCTFTSATQLTADLSVLPTAPVGARTVTIINPDAQEANLDDGFRVITATPVTPTVSGLSPTTASRGQNLLVTIRGTNFQSGATCDFGAGVLVQSCAFVSSTQLLANLTVTGAAALGVRTVTVANPGIVGGSLAAAFTVTTGNLPPINILTVAVLVNSTNPTGYNPALGSPGEFQRYPQRYLDHLQAPYEVIDTATTAPPATLGMRQLIIAGHTGLNLSMAWQSAIMSAVGGGTGFINLDGATTVGTQTHMQALFGATGSTQGAPATTLSVPAAVLPGGETPHFIAALQRKFLGDPAGDIVYAFHADAEKVVQPVAATVLTPSVGTVIAKLGNDPLIVARQTAGGRVVQVGSYLYLKADRLGFVQGVDDLFWRSMVWAARKPFVLRGYPRYWAVQMDDSMPGWETRVKDMYNPAFTGTKNSSGVGGPWKVTGYLFTENFPAGGAARASVINDVKNGKLQVTPHSFTNIAYGDMYWHAAVGQNPHALTDEEWIDNLAEIQAWKQGNGGNDAIPTFSRSLVAHFWDLSNNTGYDLWNTLGFRYITSVQKPGFQRPANPQKVNVYNGAERLHGADFWSYEQPPKLDPSESTALFFADDYQVGSRAGLPSQPFFLFATQYIDLAKYPRNDFVWPSAKYNINPAMSADHLQRYTWRHWSGMSPVQLFTHDIVNYELATAADRQAVIQQASEWLNSNGARHVFMENLGDYIYARTKSVLVDAVQTTEGLQVTLTGSAVTPDGAPVATQFLMFDQDAEGVVVTVPGIVDGTTAAVALPQPLINALAIK